MDKQHVSPYIHDVGGTVVYCEHENKEEMGLYSVLSQHTVYKNMQKPKIGRIVGCSTKFYAILVVIMLIVSQRR